MCRVTAIAVSFFCLFGAAVASAYPMIGLAPAMSNAIFDATGCGCGLCLWFRMG